MSLKIPRKTIKQRMRDDDDDSSERLSIYDAADIWASRGMDEEDTFGYDEEDLRKAFEE